VGDDPELVPLDEPRPLTGPERTLLEALVEPLAREELAQQIARAQVVAHCSCGCRSIGLRSDGPELAPAVVMQLTDLGRDDVLHVRAWATDDAGREVEVTLHVGDGTLKELEIWCSDGGEIITELPVAGSLRREPST
jgi:hypothetical protein